MECDTHSENRCLKVCRRLRLDDYADSQKKRNRKLHGDTQALLNNRKANPKECYEALCEGDIGTQLCKAVSINL